LIDLALCNLRRDPGGTKHREFSASLHTSSRAEHDSETVTLSHPVMPIADGLGS
jgi:hypothetical protein